MNTEEFQNAILSWSQIHGRKNLPWQTNINAYSVWISEIMLQQTQVQTVIPYFKKFMARFPTISALATADINDVLHYWTGLGYYARARNMHKTAQLVSNKFSGELPSMIEDLINLPGIGRSTAGAIRSIAFKKPAAILDGNVKRVLARYGGIKGWPGHSATSKELWGLAEAMSPSSQTDLYTQAMMDLGATVCTKNPDCKNCPVKSGCAAFNQGDIQSYPGKKPKKVLPIRRCCFLVISNNCGEILLQQNPLMGIWGGLWMFPQCEDVSMVNSKCENMGFKLSTKKILALRRHSFSHFHLDYYPIYIQAQISETHLKNDRQDQLWYDPKNPTELGMPKPAVKIFEDFR